MNNVSANIPNIELLYIPDCPHVCAARDQLRHALELLGMSPAWVESDISATDAPIRVKGYGSPTILVNGFDVSGPSCVSGAACRIYVGSEVQGVPPIEAIVTALKNARSRDVEPGTRG